MEIMGYSERGLLNSLFYEIRYSQNNLQLLNGFLSLVSIPYFNIHFRIRNAKILIEESFSDFGDADSVLLIDNNGSKQSVFIEAKVKTFQRQSWSIEEEFRTFEEGIKQNRVSSSNLFVQLYHKVRLIKALQNGGTVLLQKGIRFPECSSKAIRKIGDNEVVLRAVEILRQYYNDVFFVALVPDDISKVKNFYHNILKNYNPGFQEWDIKNWGCVSWAEVEDFCKKYGLEETQKVFKFNEGQIYER